ncbi:MAG: hypothetical protein PWP23_8 [Candidatus Sumerlaeota bacterium]|nr:hypothetical protein [Candidatus Sumerlaeota bacterium]
MQPWRMTFRTRLMLWYTATLSVLLLVFALQVYALARASLLGELDAALQEDAAQIQWMVRTNPLSFDVVTEEHPALPFHTVSLRENHVHASEGWRGAGLDAALAGLPFDTPILWNNPAGDTFRVLKGSGPGEARFAVAREANDARVTLRALALTLGVGIPSTLAFAVLGGALLARRSLRPVGAMARQARRLTAERLSERLPVENQHDEFGELALVFNDTLARLEDSFEQLRRFTADASHQLRTPLASIRAVGEQGLASDSPAELRETIGSMLEETDRLTALAEGLLTITRAESGQLVLHREPVDLAALALECVESLEILAEEKLQKLGTELESVPHIPADPGLLRQAILNLFDNAIKYTPEGGRIHVGVWREDKTVVFEISDSGPGIDKKDHELVFARFTRLGGENSPSGSGLGLSVARWAVELNGGRLFIAKSTSAGTTFRMEFRTPD